MRRLLIAIAALACVCPHTAHGQSASDRSLAGLSPLYVIAEDTPEEPGLKGMLRKSVESRLREAGIAVVSEAEGVKDHTAYLYVNATLLHVGDIDHYVYGLEVECRQSVHLEHNGRWFPGAQTWFESMVGIIPDDEVRNGVLESADELTDDFLRSYLGVNPRQ